MDVKGIAKTESNHSNNSALANARPGQSQHQGIELRAAQTEPVCSASSWPDKVALVQASAGKPDTDAVMHQYLHAGGTSVGKEVGGVGVGCTEDLDDSGQGCVGASSHVHRHRCQPDGVDADHLKRAVAQLANSADELIGQVMFIDSPPLRSSALISVPFGSGAGAVNLTGKNAAVGEIAARASDLVGLAS
jgi:hypothetical protein